MNNSFLNNGPALTRVADPDPVVFVVSGTVNFTRIADPDQDPVVTVVSGTVNFTRSADPVTF